MIAQNEKTVGDKVLEQFEMKIDLIATKFVNGISNKMESQKQLNDLESLLVNVLNIFHPTNEEKAESVHALFVKTTELLQEKKREIKELEWSNGVEWREMYFPELGKRVKTYYEKGKSPDDIFSNPFVKEEGIVCYYRFYPDKGYWQGEAECLGEYVEGMDYKLG